MRFFLERRNIKRLPGIALSVCFPCIYCNYSEYPYSKMKSGWLAIAFFIAS